LSRHSETATLHEIGKPPDETERVCPPVCLSGAALWHSGNSVSFALGIALQVVLISTGSSFQQADGNKMA
jgi:hypothetical protein